MATKNEVKNPLSDYEMDAMWMSYRYAIGRHTIASVMHAGNMVKNVYGRIPEGSVDFNVYNMRREINHSLEWGFNFGLDLYVPQKSYDPFKALIEFEKYLAQQEENTELLIYLKTHRVTVSLSVNNEYLFKIGEPIHSGDLYAHNLHDLLIWANAANALDPKKHHQVTTEFEGETEVHDAFELYYFHRSCDGNLLSIKYSAMDEYLKTPSVESWIAEKYITNID